MVEVVIAVVGSLLGAVAAGVVRHVSAVRSARVACADQARRDRDAAVLIWLRR
ncbi:hypothetical protein [Embleya sp. AB8]|uniref:hypothetical protein n=1 Tax=Embleya sp. AB8 TaxID=3156304 RepID=UPI003C773C26